MGSSPSQGAGQVPVKLVLERRVRPGAAPAFASWVRELVSSAARDPAHEGSSVIEAAPGEFFVLLRFRDEAALTRWQRSAEVLALLERGAALATAAQPTVRTGLETWFARTGAARAAAPPRWKMALVTWIALLPQVLILGAIVPIGVPRIASVALTTAIPVAMLTWVVMPRLTVLLGEWLHAGTAAAKDR